jgi:Arm DNA-binding domain
MWLLEDHVKTKLTKRIVDAAEPRPSGAYYIHDSEIRGYQLKVTRAGAKTFVLDFRLRGQRLWLTIGPYPDLTPDQARAIAQQARGRVARGSIRGCNAATRSRSSSLLIAISKSMPFRIRRLGRSRRIAGISRGTYCRCWVAWKSRRSTARRSRICTTACGSSLERKGHAARGRRDGWPNGRRPVGSEQHCGGGVRARYARSKNGAIGGNITKRDTPAGDL